MIDVMECYACAASKGWWDDCRLAYSHTGLEDPLGLDIEKVAAKIPEKLALIHSEVSEALEDYRTGKLETTYRADGKPEGFPSELADIVIRVFDLAGAMQIDIDAEIEAKQAYNRTRAHRHGGKAC